MRIEEYACEGDNVCSPGRVHNTMMLIFSGTSTTLHRKYSMCVSVTAERDEGRGRSKHVPRTLKVLMVLSVTLAADKLMFRIKFIPYLFRN